MAERAINLEIRPGAQLPGGTYRLGAERHDRFLAAIGDGAPADGSAHPMMAWVIAMGGCGISIGELFEAAGVPMEDGPMLGEFEVDLLQSLGVETTYTVTGEVTALQQKSGRRLGRFDVLTLRYQVDDPTGSAAAVCTTSIILPRPGETP